MPRARASVTSKLAQILEYSRERGAHVIALQEVRLTQRDVDVMDRDRRFDAYRPMLYVRLGDGVVRVACFCSWTTGSSWTAVCSPCRDDISNGRYTGGLVADAGGALWAIYVAHGPSGAWMGGAALDDSKCTFAHLTRSMDAMRARGARCVLVGDLNLVRGVDDVLASTTPHTGGLDLFASLCVAGHMRDAMLLELAGTGIFTNRCGAGRLLPAESLPFGSCARLGLCAGSAGLCSHTVACAE